MVKDKVLTGKIVFSCFLASCLEIYDFAIFGFLTVTIHKNYLSFLDQDTALIITYAFFAVGFVFRPLGSLIFGYIGDIHGRKRALVTSVSIMGFASFLMFILPTYAAIGVVSCYVIVFVRIIQGISVGGEFTGAIIFAIEHSKNNKVGLVAGIVSAGGACGVLLANLVSRLLQNPALPDYSWRFAFLFGFALAFVGYFVRQQLSDTPFFKKVKNNKIPLFEGLRNYKTESFATLWVAAANGTIFYLVAP
ncbi:MAG: MFS transporter [Rickettsiaceae bacterium]|jgi:MHS family proline/betaine transporter-like MFS transporter|nr:MFS transporter [Rickettsiaceae bacterium]